MANTGKYWDLLIPDVARELAKSLTVSNIDQICQSSKSFQSNVCNSKIFWHDYWRTYYSSYDLISGNYDEACHIVANAIGNILKYKKILTYIQAKMTYSFYSPDVDIQKYIEDNPRPGPYDFEKYERIYSR